MALKDRCLRLDAQTGQTRTTYRMPATSADGQTWGYLAYLDGILIGSQRKELGVSDLVFAIDAANGDLLWKYQGKTSST